MKGVSAKPQLRLRSVNDLYEGLSSFMANERFKNNIL
jgi:hypothetical protein